MAEEKSPFKILGAVGAFVADNPALAGTILSAGSSLLGGIFGARSANRASRRAERKERLARMEMDRMKQIYSNLDTSNPYLNMENTMEDLTINQQQAEFQKQQSMQSQANILNELKGAAGGSGIAALAQAMAGQSNQQAQQASIDIGQQEQANQRAERNAAATIQNQQIQGEYKAREQQLGKIDTMMQLTGQDLQAAQAEAAASDQMLISGIGDAAGQLVPNLGKFNPFKKK